MVTYATRIHTDASFPSWQSLIQSSVNLCSDANHTAGWTSASIARLLALGVTTLSQIVGASMDDDGSSDDAFWANQFDEAVFDGAFAIALSIRLEVAEISDVTLSVGGGAMLFAVWVD